ncbi:MAG: YihY/virulence factor BrkB family protein [Methanothrix sp.]|nr:MAG: YihY/virulence factor BrkB family protein [Methanothrix sp.]
MSPKALWKLLMKVYNDWSDDKASRLAAALAFYTILSLAPILVIVIAIAGFAFGAPVVREEIANAIQNLVGRDGADAIKMVMENAAMPGHNTIAETAGLLVLIFGAAEVFIQLKDSLNDVWDVKPRLDQGILGTIREYFFSLSMVVGIGFLLLVSLVVSAALSAFGVFIGAHLPHNDILLRIINFNISFAVTTFIFALTYKVVPDARIAWSDVWTGAGVTALLFIVGKFLIGLYIFYSAEGLAYGAAGSLVVLMIWVYYSAQIFLMGAEFTKVYAEKFGSRIKP